MILAAAEKTKVVGDTAFALFGQELTVRAEILLVCVVLLLVAGRGRLVVLVVVIGGRGAGFRVAGRVVLRRIVFSLLRLCRRIGGRLRRRFLFK